MPKLGGRGGIRPITWTPFALPTSMALTGVMVAMKSTRNTRYTSPRNTRSGCSRLQSCSQPRRPRRGRGSVCFYPVCGKDV